MAEKFPVGRPSTPLKERFDEKWKICLSTGCWLWIAGKYPAGYGRVWDGKKTRLAHRVSYELHVGPIPDGMKVLHKCDTPSCVRPDCFFLGTDLDNVVDMYQKGRQANRKGSKAGGAKLTETNISTIKVKRSLGSKLKDIGLEFGVSESVISNICNNKAWSHA